MKKTTLILILLIQINSIYSQETSSYSVYTVAFYNVENLFDTIDDPRSQDNQMTPTGTYHWNSKKYNQKVENIARVLSRIGNDIAQKPPDIIGLCEVENYSVLNDLVNHPELNLYGYQIVHEDSPDVRGIDVALLYRRKSFNPTSFKSHRLLLFDEFNQRNFTRDQLIVGGFIENEELFVIINHWPSRRGGESRSKLYRKAAARLNRRLIDSVSKINPSGKIISMGDLNDNPIDASIKHNLTSSTNRIQGERDLINPMEKLFAKGLGSLAYRDEWHLFDQILCSENLTNFELGTLSLWKARIYKEPYLITRKGVYKGYPKRTYAGGKYTGGYSDHFPVYLLLLKKKE